MTKRWRDIGSLYQIYPRSFQDTNGDGIGDLNGVTARLDYLNTLGIEAIWLSPFFTSPMTDFGYDVADYQDVDPQYGTLDDFRRLLGEAHARNIKVMIDLVPCHTSDQHPWFIESRSSHDNPKRHWYTWRDGRDGREPNNWRSLSGGSAWTLDETTGQYYLHSFLATQPDLNWDNPEVRHAIANVMRFWFDMGVDGMRVDAIWGISKDPTLADDPVNPHYQGEPGAYGAFIHNRCKYGPHFTEYLHDIAQVCTEYDDRQIIFEFYPDEQLGDIYDQYRTVMHAHPSVASAFFMEHRHASWHAERTRDAITRYLHQAAGEALPFFCVGNHDQPRVASRLDPERARALHFLNLLMPGISVVYYGDEIGMTNGDLTPQDIQDTFSPAHSVFDSRDLERTPMQWDDSPYAGFSTGAPWLPVHANRTHINVATTMADAYSLLNMHQFLLKLRQSMPLLTHGTLEPIDVGNGFLLALKRTHGEQRGYIVVNFASAEQYVTLPEAGTIIASTHRWQNIHLYGNTAVLPAYAGILLLAH